MRACIETRKFYILLPSEPPHCGLTLSSKQEWISTAGTAAPVPSEVFSFPEERSLLTSSVSSEYQEYAFCILWLLKEHY